ncbi:alpha-tocopherol transfer protein-like [Trichonephila inaurata madagascariensis]|uniref:Alpha-tocopherol transfer protein-like n=1 Tax=Trichonephila inaurata madagascariensis TaxID=2747483 RepID=A0A8X6YXH1_9ARAC|nr:alpha-tocopherol transfer protein-like [Trichonephila inaurata madagascariensis]
MTLLQLWFKGLTPELQHKAEVTLGETSHVKAKALVDFRRLINEQQDIYSRLDEVFLLRFLRTKKYDVQKAFKIFLNYYDLKSKQKGKFTGLKPSDVKKVIEMNNILYVPYRLPSGSHVAIYRMGTFDVNKATAQELVATVFLLGEMILDCEATQVCGGVIIIDTAGITIQHYRQFATVQFLSLVVNLVQDCLPERLKAIHFVNEPFTYHAIFHLIRPILKKKLKDRLHFHGSDLSSLHRYVPKDFLPEELGGNMGPFDNTEFANYFFSQEAFIERINKYGKIEKCVSSPDRWKKKILSL